jgi:hypothetical protein
MRNKSVLRGLFTIIAVSLLATSARGNDLLNGSFQSGDLSDWTPFTTSNGTAGDGFPAVASFNVTGSGNINAAEFNVGEVAFTSGDYEGAGLSQGEILPAGSYDISEDFAAVASSGNSQAQGQII